METRGRSINVALVLLVAAMAIPSALQFFGISDRIAEQFAIAIATGAAVSIAPQVFWALRDTFGRAMRERSRKLPRTIRHHHG